MGIKAPFAPWQEFCNHIVTGSGMQVECNRENVSESKVGESEI